MNIDPDAYFLIKRLAELPDQDCMFWACGGSNVEPEDMITCRVCWLKHDAKVLLKKMEAE